MHGHRARSQQRKAAKELRKTSKWAVRELHSLEGLHRRFTQDAQEALRLERWLPCTACKRRAALTGRPAQPLLRDICKMLGAKATLFTRDAYEMLWWRL